MRGSTWLLLGRLSAVFMGMATQVLLVRSLSKDDFGIWALGLALALGLQIVVSLGHNRVLSRFFAIYRERRDAGSLRGLLLMEALLILGLGTLSVAGALAWHGGLAPEDQNRQLVLVVMIILAPLQALEELLENLFAAFGRVWTIVVRQHVILPLLRLLVVVVLTGVDADVVWIAAGYVAVSATGLGFYALMLARLGRTDLAFTGPSSTRRRMPVSEVFAFSIPLLSGELVYLVNGTVSVLALGAASGALAVGALRAIIPFADANLLVRRQFFRLFLPLASALHEREEREAVKAAYWRTASWVAVLSFPVFALTGPFAEPLTTTLLGEAYSGSSRYLAVLSVAFFVNAAVGFNAELLQAIARLRYLTVVNVTTALTAGIALAVLIPRYEALGVTIVVATATVMQNVLNQMGLRKELGSALPPTPYRSVYGYLAGASVCLVVLSWWLDPGLVVAFVLSGVAGLAVLVASLPALQPAQAFPELQRVPVVRDLVRLRGGA